MSTINVGPIIPISGIVTVLGAALILMDIIGLSLWSGSYVAFYSGGYIYGYYNLGALVTASGSGIWSGILMLLAGGMGISGAKAARNGADGKCAGVASMVFSILSTINSFAMAIIFIVLMLSFITSAFVISHLILNIVSFAMSIALAAVVGRLACGTRTVVTTQYVTSGAPPVVVYGQQQQFAQQPQYAPQSQVKF